MKIRDLSEEQKKHFKFNVETYQNFLKDKCPHLSEYSHSMYARALSYIAVENKLLFHSAQQLAIALSQDILTTSDFVKIVGNDSSANQNIRLSAFRNLVNPLKDDLQAGISDVSYQTISKLLSRKGCHIRKTILENKTKNLKSATDLMKSRGWKDLQEIVKKLNVKYNQIVSRFLKTNEIPDYVTLRNILVANLYCLNSHQYNELTVHVILKNEYRTAYVWIGDKEPPQDKNHYFWINLNTNKHYFVINRVKAISNVKETVKERKMFVLPSRIVNMIVFIKQTFNESADKPFFKNNVREAVPYSTDWIRIINKIFEDVGQGVCSSTLKTIYMNEIDWGKVPTNDIAYICYNLCRSKKDTAKLCGTPSDNQDSISSEEDLPPSSDSSSVVVF